MGNRAIFQLLLFVFTCNYAFGDTAPGPRGSPIKPGHFATGLEYVFSEVDVKADSATLGPLIIPEETIQDIELNRVFFVPSYAVFDFLTVFARVGTSEMSVDKGQNAGNLAGGLGRSDWDFSVGAGFRAAIYKKDRFYWSVSGQVTRSDFDGFNQISTLIAGIPATGDAEIKLYDYQFTTGPAYEILDGWTISAGPFFQFIDADARLRASTPAGTLKTTIDIDEDEWLGGYISSQLMLTEKVFWNLRFSATGSGYIVGTTISYAF